MIKGIIFDLGHTLVQLTRNIDEVAREGAETLASWYLKKKHVKLDQTALIETFLAERDRGWELANQTHVEVLATQTLRDTLDKIEAPPATKTKVMLEAAIKTYFEPEQAAWQVYVDTIETLNLLKQQGYRLGLYSNASDDRLIQRLVNENRLRPHLSITFSSAGWGWRKPKPEPFELIANRWELLPEEIVVVGDTLNADILGAQNAGMPGILVTMRESPSNDDNRHIKPTATAERLSALPGLIANL